MTERVYHLRFRSPLRIGERGVGLEATRTYIPADTLFSAVCSAWRLLYDTDSLQSELLHPFSKAQTVPFLISSAFPFAGEVCFYPKPLGIRPSNLNKSEKIFKRVRFVSKIVFQQMIEGSPPDFQERDCANGDLVWLTYDERKSLNDCVDEATGKLLFWKTTVVPRVTLDRITNASQIWHMGMVQFVKGAGLWFAVRFLQDSEAIVNKFEACLRLLEDSGIGGERGAGLGLFRFESKDHNVPNNPSATRFMTLSPFCPASKDELQSLLGEQVSYDLILRRGWIDSPEGGNLRRKQLWMFGEGSVLTGNPQAAVGSLQDTKPDGIPDLHPVYRYGYAFPVGVKE